MKSVNELNLPQDRKYTAEHVWFKMEGDLAVCGITDFAQDQLGEVAFVDVSAQGEHVEAGKEFGSVESVKSVNGLFMPVSGEIVEANAALEKSFSDKLLQYYYIQRWNGQLPQYVGEGFNFMIGVQ